MPLRTSLWRRALCPSALGALLAFACVTQHDDFKKSPDSSNTAGHAGSAGASGSGGLGGQDAGVDSGIDSGPSEPPGPNLLTFVHGVVDAPSLALCFGKLADGGAVEPFGSPLGSGPLPFGGSLALSALSGADFASDTLIPLLIAGDLARIAGLDCAGAVALAEQTEQAFNDSVSASDAGIGAAGAPAEDAGSSDAGGSDAGSAATSALRLRELPALVAGTLNGMRSTLLVATGCMGGFGFDNGSVSMLCGASYTPTTPTLFPVFVTLSRLTEAGRVGMQVVHASRATSYVSVSIMGAPPASIGFELVSRLYAGQLGPKPPSFEHPASDYAPQSEIEVGGSISPINQTISQALGGLGKQLVDGSSYALILIGPRLDFGTPPPLWNSAQAVIVPTLSP